MTMLNERIARLEQKAIDNERQNREILKKLDELAEDTAAAKHQLSKYQGIFGFVVFITTCLGVFFTALPIFKK